jgi:hypothetical protein
VEENNSEVKGGWRLRGKADAASDCSLGAKSIECHVNVYLPVYLDLAYMF